LWICQHLFTHVPKSVGYKRIFLLTNDENPCKEQSLKKTVERSKELLEDDITIELFALKNKNKSFDSSLFWEKIIAKDEDDYTGRITFDYCEKFDQLKEKIRRKEFKKRVLNSIELKIGNDISIAIGLYNMVNQTTKQSAVWLQNENNNPIQTETKYICQDTGSELMKNDIKLFFTYGASRGIFDKEEIQRLSNISEQGLRVLGFKPKSRLKIYQNFRSSLFAYPNDKLISGSSSAFSALLKKMIEMEKIAICTLTQRKASAPVYVALVPQQEVLDENQNQIEPPGFHIIYLPYADGIRKLLSFERKQYATEKQVLKAKKLVSKLYIDFSSYNFENPSLQQHYASLQALALDHKEVDPITDYIQPDLEGMSKYDNVIEDFKDSVYPVDYVFDEEVKPKAASKKRKTRDEDDDDEVDKKKVKKETKSKKVKEVKEEEEIEENPKKATKRPNTNNGTTVVKSRKKKEVKSETEESQKTQDEDEEDEEEEIDIVALCKKGELGKLKNDILKAFLKQYKLSVSGKKEELIQRISEYLKKRGKI
jgi:ATP-dependent DNA helicase 2 subunit 1